MRASLPFAFAIALGVALPLACAGPSFAQVYPGATPVPRSTDAAALRELAIRREVVERIRAGAAAERDGRWADAEASLVRAVALHPIEPQGSTALYDLALAQANLREFAAAAASLREAISRDPGFLAARANLVVVLLSGGDLDGARGAADAFVRAAPSSARAVFSSGLVALRQNDEARALRAFRELIARDPAYAVAHYEVALAEEELGAFADAERELRDAIGLAPKYARARLALGIVLLHEGKRGEARTTFDDVARDGRDVALRNLAVSLRDALAH